MLVPDVIRKEMERCESLQGFQICFSLGGGTGSGLGASLLRRLYDEWPDKITSAVAIFTSPKVRLMENSLLSIFQTLTSQIIVSI